MKGESNGTDHVRPIDADPRGSGGNRAGKRTIDPRNAQIQDGYLPDGGIRPTIAQLRERAELVRAIEPSPARRYILDLATILDRDTREVEGWTYGDAYYVVRVTTERLERRQSATRR